MHPLIEEIIDAQMATTAQGEKHKIDSPILREDGLFIQEIIRGLKPEVTLEVGLSSGVSALFICEALLQSGGKRHIVIDPRQRESGVDGLGLANLQRAQFADMIEFYGEPSHMVLPQLEARRVGVDFAFINGLGTFDCTLTDFFLIDRLLRIGGILVIHACWLPHIQKVCRYLVTNRAYTVRDCLESPSQNGATLKGNFLRAGARRFRILQRLLRPEFLEPDATLALRASRCIAFQKQAEDVRRGDFHREF